MKNLFNTKLFVVLFFVFVGFNSAFSQSWQLVTPKYSTNDAIVAGFVADAATYGNGVTDATEYIQNCLNRLDNYTGDPNHGGGVLYLPEGRYKVSGTLIIPKGVTLRGDWQKPVKGQPIKGTVIMAYSGKGSENGTPFIMMEPAAAVMDLAFWYPEQDANNITPYPPTIQFGRPNYFGNEFCNAKNITLVNTYSGIFFYRGGGTCPTINGVYGTPLKQGIEIDRIVDIGRTEWCDFSPAYWAGSGLPGSPSINNSAYTQWIYNNGSGIVMRRNDWSYTCYLNVEGYNKGFYATKTIDATDNATPNGHNYGFYFKNCKYGLYFDGDNPVGCMFTEVKTENCEYGAYLAPSTGGVLQLYKWDINATNAAIFADGTSTTKITLQESLINSGKVLLQGGTLVAMDNDFKNNAPQIELEANSRGDITGNRFEKPVQILENSIFVNKISHEAVNVKKLPDYVEFKPQSKKPSRNVMYNVLDFGAQKGTINNIPATDATTAIQNALNRAGNEGGGIVYLPPGHYRLNGSLTIPTGVELKGGIDVSAFPLGPGSVLEIYGEKNNENGPSPINMQSGSGLRGIVIDYPEQVFCQVLPSSVNTYPYTIQVQGSNAYIVNVGLRAAYKGVDIFTHKSDNFYIDFLTGHVFNEGVKVGGGSSDGIISNMQFNTIVYNCGDESKFGGWPNSLRSGCSNDPLKNPYDYNAKYLDFLIVENAPNILLYNDFNYCSNNGIVLKNGAQGLAIGLGLDGDRTGILVDGATNFDFINTQDVALNFDNLGDKSNYIKTTPNFSSGSVNLFSSDYWGQATSSGIIMDGSGTVYLQSANFESPGSNSFAAVNGGRLEMGCSVINPKNPLFTGSVFSGIHVTGSVLNHYDLNTTRLGSWNNNMGIGADPSAASALDRTNWIATASFNADGCTPRQGIDSDAASRWTPGWQVPGQWYQIDMQTSQTFNEIILEHAASPNDYPRGYIFLVSDNGTDWTQLATGTGTGQMTIINFPQTTSRYFRIEQTKGDINNPQASGAYWAIHELYAFNVNIDIPDTGQKPFKGVPFAIPGTIEAEDFDLGGEGVAYHDQEPGHQNAGQEIVYRPEEGVEIESYAEGQYNIGFTNNGEWLKYTIEIAEAGLYNIDVMGASGNGNGAFHLEIDGVDISGRVSAPNTNGSWSNWKAARVPNVQLRAGVHVLTWHSYGSMNLDKFIFTKAGEEPTPNPAEGLAPNPFIKREVHGYYAADPSAHVWNDGRLYVYASRDVEPARGCDLMDGYRVYSTDDMVNWTDHGEILHSSQVSWGRTDGGFMWAPDCAYKNGTYYFYFPHPTGDENWNATWKIGVATSTEPAANFTVQGYIEGLESLIDPCVFVDDDGKAYIYHGGGGKCMGGELNNDMMSVKGSMKLMQGLGDFHEAPWVHKYNGKYYLSHSDNNSNGGNNMKYAISDSPLGPWKDMGTYMYPVGSETAHGSIAEYKGQWYAFYHASYSGDPWLRSACVDSLSYNTDGSIQIVKRREYGTPYKEHIVRETNNTTDIALVLEAEDYNNGGEGIGYHDMDAVNKSNSLYRPEEGVDIDSYGEGEYSIGFTDNGEWTQYTIFVEKSGLYDIESIVASDNDNGKFYLKFNEQNLTGDLSFESTGGWSVWGSAFARNIPLYAGENYMKFFTYGNMNIDKFIFRKSAPYSGTPYNGIAAVVPGKVEAENYDEGGMNIAFFDTTPTNEGGATYRNDAVDIQTNANGFHLSHTEGGEWLRYTIDVAESGLYDVECLISVGNASGSFSIDFDDMDIYPTVSQPTTGWDNFEIVTVKDVYLTAGTHVMKFNTNGGMNVDWFNFKKINQYASLRISDQMNDVIKIGVYPNPSDGYFTFNMPQAGDITIIDTKGSIVHKGKLADSVNYINISGCAPGVYIALIKINNQVQRIKLIKK